MFSVRTETQNEDVQAPDETVQEQTVAVANESSYKDGNPTSNGKIKEREVSDIVYIGY